MYYDRSICDFVQMNLILRIFFKKQKITYFKQQRGKIRIEFA